MKRALFFLLLIPAYATLTAFCGFYVAKADVKLTNKTSQVILVRSGNQTVVTMESDFQGDLKDFAMVVPVPEVLKRDQIRVVRPDLFAKINAYSGPRLVEYHDQNPCQTIEVTEESLDDFAPTRVMATSVGRASVEKKEKVTIEAEYTVGGYDILILSAKESDALETWLIQNGYKIPKGASEVLKPYIKNELKFFVVKVNLEEFGKLNIKKLQPIQMTFKTEKFGLPIRLGMANADGDQDMVVYSFTDQGRVETTNYRNVEMPSNMNIPTVIRKDFTRFYGDMYTRAWEKADKSIAMLEYTWNISGFQAVKCDPCPSPPLAYRDLREAGVFWLNSNNGYNYAGQLHFTRLRFRYNRKHFSQDLQFQVTPNKQHFQARYVMQNPAQGDMTCTRALPYLHKLQRRRVKEMEVLADLTGWNAKAFYPNYLSEIQQKISVHPENQHDWIKAIPDNDDDDKGFVLPVLPGGPFWPLTLVVIMLALGVLRFVEKRNSAELA
ncbi:MAG: DUF2330 domain-containing protein [Bacteroidia bacterium]